MKAEGRAEGRLGGRQLQNYQGLWYVPEIIRTELISRHNDDLLAVHFGIENSLPENTIERRFAMMLKATSRV